MVDKNNFVVELPFGEWLQRQAAAQSRVGNPPQNAVLDEQVLLRMRILPRADSTFLMTPLYNVVNGTVFFDQVTGLSLQQVPDEDEGCLAPPLYNTLCHYNLSHLTAADVVYGIENIMGYVAETYPDKEFHIAGDTVRLGPDAIERLEFLQVQSPTCRITKGFDAYLASLPERKRSKVKRTLAKFDQEFYQEFMSEDLLPSSRWVAQRLRERWSDPADAYHALAQYNVFLSAFKDNKGADFSLIYRKYSGGTEPVAMGYFLYEGSRLMYQGMVQFERVQGLGPFMLFDVVRKLTTAAGAGDETFTHFDVTCETNPFAVSSIDTYKRGIVNQAQTVYMFAAKTINSEVELYPPYYEVGTGWVFPEDGKVSVVSAFDAADLNQE